MKTKYCSYSWTDVYYNKQTHPIKKNYTVNFQNKNAAWIPKLLRHFWKTCKNRILLDRCLWALNFHGHFWCRINDFHLTNQKRDCIHLSEHLTFLILLLLMTILVHNFALFFSTYFQCKAKKTNKNTLFWTSHMKSSAILWTG